MAKLKLKGRGLGENVYDGAASFGRFMSWVSLIVGHFIGILLIIIGIYLLMAKTDYTQTTSALIKEATCTEPPVSSENKQYNCTLKLEYIVDGKQYEKMFNSTDKKYSPNTSITIFYNPKDPNDIILNGNAMKLGGVICILFGLFIIGGVWLHWYIVQHYKVAAAATAAYTVYETVT
jgi:hypothetical protein